MTIRELNGWKKWTEEKPKEGEGILVYACSPSGYAPVHMGPAIYRLIDEYNKDILDSLYWIKLPTFN